LRDQRLVPAGDALDLDESAGGKIPNPRIIEGSHRATRIASLFFREPHSFAAVNLVCCGAL